MNLNALFTNLLGEVSGARDSTASQTPVRSQPVGGAPTVADRDRLATIISQAMSGSAGSNGSLAELLAALDQPGAPQPTEDGTDIPKKCFFLGYL